MVEYVLRKPFQIEAVTKEIPAPARTEVQVCIHHIGICGSDIHVYHIRML